MSKPRVVDFIKAAQKQWQREEGHLRAQYNAMVVALGGLDGTQTLTEPQGLEPGRIDLWVEGKRYGIECLAVGYSIGEDRHESPLTAPMLPFFFEELHQACEYLAQKIVEHAGRPAPEPPKVSGSEDVRAEEGN